PFPTGSQPVCAPCGRDSTSRPSWPPSPGGSRSDPSRIITHRLPLDQAPHGFDIFKEQTRQLRKDDIDALITRWDLNTELINGGNQVGALVYGLLDAVVD